MQGRHPAQLQGVLFATFMQIGHMECYSVSPRQPFLGPQEKASILQTGLYEKGSKHSVLLLLLPISLGPVHPLGEDSVSKR